MKLQLLQLTIVSPEGVLYEGKVGLVTLPGAAGSFTILPEHAPLISSLRKGILKYEENDEKKSLEIESGFVEVKDNIVSVCVES